MPASYPEQYFPIAVQIILAMVIAGAMVGASYLLGQRVRNPVKDSAYESGMTPIGNARERFSVKFYLVAMLFILFDVEVVFLYPWAVVYRSLGLFGFVEMLMFFALVLCGFYYIWKKGVLDWVEEPRSETRPPEHGR